MSKDLISSPNKKRETVHEADFLTADFILQSTISAFAIVYPINGVRVRYCPITTVSD